MVFFSIFITPCKISYTILHNRILYDVLSNVISEKVSLNLYCGGGQYRSKYEELEIDDGKEKGMQRKIENEGKGSNEKMRVCMRLCVCVREGERKEKERVCNSKKDLKEDRVSLGR